MLKRVRPVKREELTKLVAPSALLREYGGKWTIDYANWLQRVKQMELDTIQGTPRWRAPRHGLDDPRAHRGYVASEEGSPKLEPPPSEAEMASVETTASSTISVGSGQEQSWVGGSRLAEASIAP